MTIGKLASFFFSFAVVTGFAASAFAQGEAGDPKAPPAKPTPNEKPAAQDEGDHPAPNSIYLEGLGAGLAYSLNYERRVIDDLGVRVGFSYLSVSAGASAGGSSSSASSR